MLLPVLYLSNYYARALEGVGRDKGLSEYADLGIWLGGSSLLFAKHLRLLVGIAAFRAKLLANDNRCVGCANRILVASEWK